MGREGGRAHAVDDHRDVDAKAEEGVEETGGEGLARAVGELLPEWVAALFGPATAQFQPQLAAMAAWAERVGELRLSWKAHKAKRMNGDTTGPQK